MKRVSVIVKGEVQRVGYRDVVEKIARKLKLTGFVENLKPYDVRVIAEGEEEVLKKFIELIDIKKYPVDVEKVVVRFDAPTGEFEYFEIKRGEWHEELGERMDIAGTLLYKSVELSEKSVNIGEKMLGKQDQTVSIIREGNEKVTKEIREGNEKVTGKLDRIHTDLSVNLKDFHKDTIARFDVVDDKYGKISENIEKAIYSINRTCDNTEKLLEKSERDRKDYRKSLDDLVGAIVKLAEKK